VKPADAESIAAEDLNARQMTNEAAPSPPKITLEQVTVARELLGWSQMDVANRVGFSEWVIGFYERGEHLIGARYLRRVSSIFEAAYVIFVEENGRACACASGPTR
jgi:ribosome-binding protein aMBF1 (putative translation factor)